ncbi:MAG TPA: S24 family peptidase [Bryobacteraceae bacterium]|nr:S24 family peptidase [Bryobacteraceae bacterium]
MPAAAVSTQLGKFAILQAEVPGQGLVNLGVLLQDSQSDTLRLRCRRDMETLASDDDLDLLTALSYDLGRKAVEMGAERLFAYLEDTLSGSVRVTDRESVMMEDFDRAVDRLYRRHVESNVVPFRTHLPRYSLRAAAGKFLDNAEITEDGWVETPENMPHLYPDMFVAEIAGRSMEPLIPDGSFCVFRAGVTGSRTGRLVLAEDRENNAFAVKRYRSEKAPSEEGWKHQRIRLESLNPGYPSWDLDPDEEKYRIVAEFIRVLD